MSYRCEAKLIRWIKLDSEPWLLPKVGALEVPDQFVMGINTYFCQPNLAAYTSDMALDQVDVDKLPKEGEKEMSFLEHLEELRWHLIRSAVAVVFVGIGVFVAGQWIFEEIIFAPKEKTFATYQFICRISEKLCFYPPEFQLTTINFGEQFIIHLKVAIVLGVIVAFPYILWELWRFIKPGLLPKERKAARGIVAVCSLLFLSGVLFGYFVVAPFAVTFLASYSVGAENTPTLSSFVHYMTMFTLPTGIVFELPIVVYFLAKVGLIYPSFMKKYRKHAFVIILILSAIITPPDVITQFLIGTPLYFLYEASILICKRVNPDITN